MPVFVGLLPKSHNDRVLKLHFRLKHWHGLAKLRMHTDNTLHILEFVTEEVGTEIRQFISETCSAYATKELKCETECCMRAEARKKGGAPVSHSKDSSGGHRGKRLSLHTYKLHALGDYAVHIRLFRTTDSFSTQPIYL